MQEQTQNFVKLGLFVLAGLALLILTLFLLGKNRRLFGGDLEVKTHFKAVNGLVAGNNVRYAGIDVGSVRAVELLNDTVVEVTLSLDRGMDTRLRANAVASLGTDGLIGDRVINLGPGAGPAPFVQPGALLPSAEEIDAEKMLRTLYRTNDNLALISQELLVTLHRVNNSALLLDLLDDRTIPRNLKASLVHLHETVEKASAFMTEANATLALASQGNGTLATLLTDTTIAVELRAAVGQLQTVEAGAERLARDLDAVVASVDRDYRYGRGPVQVLLRDSTTAAQLQQTVENAAEATAAFTANMEALKHNFLFRRYFKKLEKAKRDSARKAP
jgi:phospholipid/cholesterol/gamma-HCH transport system substrate-binding protein